MSSDLQQTVKAAALTAQQTVMLNLVTRGILNENTKRSYTTALTDFFQWHIEQGLPPLSRPVIEAYLANFTKQQKKKHRQTTSSLAQRLAVIRKLIKLGVEQAAFEPALLTAVASIKIPRQKGTRTGIWLSAEEAQLLLSAPDESTLRGKRDRAILGVMLVAGLRRAEVASLTFKHLKVIERRWVIADLVGKKNRVRTIPIPDWVMEAIDLWGQTGRIKEGHIFRPIDRNDKVIAGRENLTPQTIRNVVGRYAKQLSLSVAAHDLRRTFAKLSHNGGAAIDQIQLSLGHESLDTTLIYLGVKQNIIAAPCDFLPY